MRAQIMKSDNAQVEQSTSTVLGHRPMGNNFGFTAFDYGYVDSLVLGLPHSSTPPQNITHMNAHSFLPPVPLVFVGPFCCRDATYIRVGPRDSDSYMTLRIAEVTD